MNCLRLIKPRYRLTAGDNRHLLTREGAIKLCWAGSGEASNHLGNLGDCLSPLIVASLAGRSIHRSAFDDRGIRMLGIGSIGHSARGGTAVIWGSGCYRPDILREQAASTQHQVLPTRGELSRRCLEAAGIPASISYGEPAWFLPAIFREPVEKRFELGIISHISDLQAPALFPTLKEEWSGFTIPEELQGVVVQIHCWHEPTLAGIEEKVRLMRSCKRLVSRSFHGLAIAEAYGIPSLPICSHPKVPAGAFDPSGVDPEFLDKRVRDYFSPVRKGGSYFLGLQRKKPVDWKKVIEAVDAHWQSVEYDLDPMLESFPFEISNDPLTGPVPLQAALSNLRF